MNDTQKVVVIGQGYVGLPVAMRAVEVGYNVVGIDIDQQRVDALNDGVSYVEDISAEELSAALCSGRYCASSSYSPADDFDVAVITVPTPLRDSVPDLSYIEDAGQSLAQFIRPGATVILESTTHPGTTEEILLPLLQAGSGLSAGNDFYIGFSPERIDPGNTVWSFVTTPKVVSGINTVSLERVDAFYNKLVDTTVPVKSPREAELAKLLENTFRHVNIALVNEMAIFARDLGVDIWASIDAAATKPFGFMKFTPGPGVGGHCLPVDPSYLSWEVRKSLGKSFRFVDLANDINDHMPDYVVQRAMELLNEHSKALRGSRVVVVGVAYKKNSGDYRESPALRIIELLNGFGATVLAADPFVADRQWPASAERVELNSTIIDSADLAIIVTDHDDFDYELFASTETPVLDTRNRLRPLPNTHAL